MQEGPDLDLFCRGKIEEAAKKLHKAKMAQFNKNTGSLAYTEIGRIASHLYINRKTIELFNEKMPACIDYEDILHLVSQAAEFRQLQVTGSILVGNILGLGS